MTAGQVRSNKEHFFSIICSALLEAVCTPRLPSFYYAVKRTVRRVNDSRHEEKISASNIATLHYRGISIVENRASLAGRRRRGWSRCGGIYERKSPKSVVGGQVTRSLYRRQTVSNRVTTAICRPLIDNNDTIIPSAWTASVLPMQRLLHTVSP